MISKRIIANLTVFFALSVLLIGYGVVTLFGSPFDQQRTLVADLPDAGGLRPGFSASHDGVVVGTVADVALRAGEVRVTVQLDDGVTVPEGVEARVVRASAVGEQRLDLASVPGGSDRILADGAAVAVGEDPIPPDVADVLETTVGLIDALPAEDLNTVIHEAAVGLEGRAGDLRSITRSLTTISEDVVAGDDELRRLLEEGPPVLDDFSEMSPAVHGALADTEVLTRILADRKDDLVALLRSGADLSEVADEVLLENQANLTCLVDDLRGLAATVQGETLADLDEALRTNTQFFGLVDKISGRSATVPVGYGPARPDQLWLRTSLLFPPQTPAASSYAPPRSPLPVLAGEACANEFGPGAGATDEPPADVAARPRVDQVATGSPASGDGASGGGLLPAVPVGQASEPDPANGDVVPLITLAIGAVLAAATLLPAARNRRRAR